MTERKAFYGNPKCMKCGEKNIDILDELEFSIEFEKHKLILCPKCTNEFKGAVNIYIKQWLANEK